MGNVWLSALLGDGKSRRIKHMLCDSGGNPLLFDTQLNALRWWRSYKDRFSVPAKFDRRYDRVTPQVVRDDYADGVLFEKLDQEEYQPIQPKECYVLYSDDQQNPEWVQ